MGADLSLKDFPMFAVIKKILSQQEFLLDNLPSVLKDKIVSSGCPKKYKKT
jgi:hypothetical protein